MMRGGKSRSVVCAVVVVTLWGLICAWPAAATITTTGDIDPPYDDSDPWILVEDLVIGDGGNASVLISEGGRLVSGQTRIGSEAWGNSVVEVTGTGSSWESLGMLYLGDQEYGSGTVTVSNGACLVAPGVFFGSKEGSLGYLTVTGPGTTWQGGSTEGISGFEVFPADEGAASENRIVAAVGGNATSGYVTVSDGARVTADGGLLYLGYSSNAFGSLVVTGPNSVWEDNSIIRVGHYGAGSLMIQDGGTMTTTCAAHIGGTSPTSSGNATVGDSGSLWQINGGLYVGGQGTGELAIRGGGRVASVVGLVGYAATGGGEVIVDNEGSLWENESSIQVGVAGTGHLSISGGGRVTTNDAFAGSDPNGEGTIAVEGAGSALEVEQDLIVGVYGHGDLSISGGGLVSAADATLASDVGSTASATITGEDSLLAVTNGLDIGGSGDANMVISNGARVTALEASLAVGEDSNTVVVVTGAGSTLDVETDLNVGLGGGADLRVAEGGRVITGAYAAVGYDGTGHATVDGAGSRWDSEGVLTVGMGGAGDLTISNGGLVAGGEVSIGLWDVGSITVTDPNSRLEYLSLHVGRALQGTLTISNGARAVGGVCEIAKMNTPTGTLIVTGSGSVLENHGDLSVGTSGKGTLLVSEGGRVENGGEATIAGPTYIILPLEAGSVGILSEIIVVEPNLTNGPSIATVTGEGSAWINAGSLYVGGGAGGQYGDGRLRILDGGLVEANDVYVWSTGRLQGDGTLRADSVLVNGTVRPGNSIGTLTIDGDVTFDPCGVLEVEISNAAADRLAVTGDVEIAGGTVRSIATETIVGSHQYTIVEANSVSGQFDALDTALVDSFILLESAELGYQSDAVVLAVTATDFDDPNIVRTGNQASLGSALQQVAEEGGNGVTTALQQLQTGGEVEAAYDQLNGQTRPSLAPVTVAGTTRHVGVIAGRLRNPAGGVASNGGGFGESSMSFAAGDTMSPDAGRYLFAAGNGTPVLGDKPWGVWGKGYGLYGDRESESGVPGYQYTVYGAAFGLDYRFTERLLLGFTMGYSQGDIDYSGSRDNSDVDATHAGVYGGYDTPHWYLDSILTYTDLEYETHRFVDLLDERLEADPSGNMLTAYFEAGLNWRRGERTLIQPLAGLQLSTMKIDGFTETGGDSALAFDDQRYDSYKGSLGARLTQQLFERENGSRMELELRGRWVHEFGDTTASLDAGFASDPGATFRISDGDIARDSAVLGAGLDTWFTRQTRVFVDYGTELNPDNTIQVVTAGLEHRW